MTDPPSIPPENQMTPPLLFYSAVSVIKNSVTTLSFTCLFLFYSRLREHSRLRKALNKGEENGAWCVAGDSWNNE